MRNDELSLLQKLVGHADAFTQQSAGILAQIEDQTLQMSPNSSSASANFMFGGLLEAGDVHVADAGLDQEMNVDAVARNLVAHNVEVHRLVGAFAQDRDLEPSCPWGL